MSVKLDGKLASMQIYEDIKQRQKFFKDDKILAIVTIGEDEASKVYVNTKKTKTVECGYKYQHIQLSKNTNFFELEEVIKSLNSNPCIKGIIIQKPLPQHLALWDNDINLLVDPSKDVDGFHPMSRFKACTPKGIITLLDMNKVEYKGKNVVIAGRSQIVAQPLAKMFMDADCTVTMIHSKTDERTVKQLLKNCDVFVSAIGRPNYWTGDFFNERNNRLAIVDVGINRIFSENEQKYKVVGDVHPNCYKYFDYYTPVPGGVGLMTVATLIDNLSNTK